MRVLVCGGRDFDDWERLSKALSDIHANTPITTVIHGAARGADTMAADWARWRQIRTDAYPADWKTHGRSAGILRNIDMLTRGRPDLVVAFPGGNGTAHMVQIARVDDVKVVEP